MKIFALNLCLDFVVNQSPRPSEDPPMSFAELMGYFFKGTDYPGQEFEIEADGDPELLDHLFELQKNEVFREIPATVRVQFKSHKAREAFVEPWLDLFKHVDAAGGLVQNEVRAYLCINTRNKWTLPKGRVEWLEPVEEAAVREVQEETGVQEIQLLDEIGKTFHTFRRGRNWVLKTTHWFRMKASSGEELVPQEEEGIQAVSWKSKEEWLKVADDTYPLIRHLFEQEFSKSLI